MEKHFVRFYSPGTFFSEVSELPIDSWDVQKACELAKTIKERYNATPHSFMFFTKSRGEKDLDSVVTNKSNVYWLGGKVETIEEVEARNDPKDDILISNMRINKHKKIITNSNSWKFTGFFDDEHDIVLPWPQ